MKRKLKAILLDLDGTVYYGSRLIKGADQAVEYFRDHGIRVLFLTNNSTKNRKQIQEKLIGMGLECYEEEIYTSGYAAALYAGQMGYDRVYIFGTEALKMEFRDAGIEVSDHAPVVVIGYDMEFDYRKLTDALQAALHAETIIACNTETHYPGENAMRMPGCGAMVGALEGSLGRKVDYIVGKPNTLLLNIICEQQGLDKNEIMVVGDTYESDIIMSREFGCRSVYIHPEEYSGAVTAISIKDIPAMLENNIL